MFALLAFGSWPTILLLIGAAAIVWCFFRAVVDGITWFREEILEDFHRRNRGK